MAAAVAAASVALRGQADPGLVVYEPPGGPRFPNGLVSREPVDLPVTARRWWDPKPRTRCFCPDRVEHLAQMFEPLALPDELVGWGPGLTPAGDDVVVGRLVAYRAGGLDDHADDLHARSGADTVPFSRVLIDHAARGEAAGPVVSLVDALGGLGDLDDAVQRLLSFGATSGRHLIDGVRTAATETTL